MFINDINIDNMRKGEVDMSVTMKKIKKKKFIVYIWNNGDWIYNLPPSSKDGIRG
jgi:hypothetical protein